MKQCNSLLILFKIKKKTKQKKIEDIQYIFIHTILISNNEVIDSLFHLKNYISNDPKIRKIILTLTCLEGVWFIT